jgi:hypothetical protein
VRIRNKNRNRSSISVNHGTIINQSITKMKGKSVGEESSTYDGYGITGRKLLPTTDGATRRGQTVDGSIKQLRASRRGTKFHNGGCDRTVLNSIGFIIVFV